MYCSSCGIEVTQELNYCNRCGANLNVATNLAPQIMARPVRLTGPTIALCIMVVLSITATFSGAGSLALRGVPPLAITWMVIISLAMVFGITGLVIRLWTSLLTNASGMSEQQAAQLKKPQPNPQLQAPQTGPMNVPKGSVTDHTTRTFEPIYRERAERGK